MNNTDKSEQLISRSAVANLLLTDPPYGISEGDDK